ncbi:rod shape-determining protein MreD [Lentibacillus amyloliquefaciens]|uniref:Rod shape-determining protein MreD n=1 Tax=Lentibacillus amyloliquefaciens TaxID=1472767 RepID=A0A0U4FHV4_9BACI|nr:rod shape-determining protein MreD [Lentibacillus amyloliquefaciens]ALX48206.1 rod shape-determining protein MreD [Lentibacillus amyloliquefaciens]
MKRLLILGILFLLLVLEGVALDMLPGSLLTGDLIIVSHWVFVFLAFLAIFFDREDTYFSVFYALLAGLLIDISYTGILGVYMFSYALSVYIVHGLTKLLHSNFFVTILLGAIGLILAEVFIYLIYSMTGIAELGWEDYLINRMIPTLLANILFLLVLYPFTANRLVNMRDEQLSGNRQF